MNKQQRQIVIGSLLGKAYITKINRKNYFLTIPESVDINWLRYKAIILGGTDGDFVKDGKRTLWRSKCDPIWNKIREEFYDNCSKTITMRILDELYDEGLCVWFLDRGSFLNRKLLLRTTSFGENGNIIIAKYFNEVGIPCEIKKERNTGKILFTDKGTFEFLKLVRRVIPNFMSYRLI